jgi:2-dehydro-3-deoxyphosphogluconate aldolase/(4S)-4-hydroxy-2-oxoglutarate aldolase
MTLSLRSILASCPVIPVLTIERLEDAVPIGKALAAGGLRVLEITLRSSVALQAVTLLREALPDAIVGAGTLKSPEDFQAAVRAGAQFTVSPGLTRELAAATRDSAVPLLPGIMTATELMQGLALGFDTFKLFPAQQAGGVGMLKALGAPFPEVKFCPTGGITRVTAAEFLALPNVLCVGGSWVAPTEKVRCSDWAALEALACDALTLKTPPR